MKGAATLQKNFNNSGGDKSMKKFFAALLLGAGLIAGAPAQTQQPVVIKWAHGYETSEPFHTQAQAMAQKIKVATAGRVEIELYPASALGGEADYSKKLAAGEIDMAYIGLNVLARDYAPLGVVGFPFLFSDPDHVRRFLVSPVFDELRKGYEAQSRNHLMAAIYYGARHVTSNKPITSPKDMLGLKLRVPDAPTYKLFAKSMGATATPMPFAKVYDALKSGEIDAQENPLPTILAKKFYEVQKSVTLTGHMYDMLGIVISPAALQRMNAGDRTIVNDIIRKDAVWASVQIIARELVAEGKLGETGIKVIRPDRQAFVEAALKAVSPADLQARPGDYEKIRDLVKAGAH